MQLLPRIKEIGGDTNQLVRSALAAVVMELAPILGKVMQWNQWNEMKNPSNEGTDKFYAETCRHTCRLKR